MVLARLTFFGGVLYMVSTFSGWWILLLFLVGLIPVPERKFTVSLKPEQIAEAFIGEVKRNPEKYKRLMQ